MDFQQMPIRSAMALAQNSALWKPAALSREAQSDILTRAHGARSEAEMHRIVSGRKRLIRGISPPSVRKTPVRRLAPTHLC